MTTPAELREINRPIPGERSGRPLLALLLGWLIPGAGYLVTGKYIRAALTAISIFAMVLIGLALGAKIYQWGTGDILDSLGFAGQLGLGAVFGAIKAFSLGHLTQLTTVQEYGTKFVVGAGLLNVIAAVDAHALASGRKLSIEDWNAPALTAGATVVAAPEAPEVLPASATTEVPQ